MNQKSDIRLYQPLRRALIMLAILVIVAGGSMSLGWIAANGWIIALLIICETAAAIRMLFIDEPDSDFFSMLISAVPSMIILVIIAIILLVPLFWIPRIVSAAVAGLNLIILARYWWSRFNNWALQETSF